MILLWPLFICPIALAKSGLCRAKILLELYMAVARREAFFWGWELCLFSGTLRPDEMTLMVLYHRLPEGAAFVALALRNLRKDMVSSWHFSSCAKASILGAVRGGRSLVA